MRKNILTNKKAAMEMSVGTIVTIVLLVSVLVLGIFLIQRIFFSARNVVDLTDQQLTEEVNKLFSNPNQKIVVYPSTREVTIQQTERGGVGFGVKNLLTGISGSQKFSYNVVVESRNKCTETEVQILDWIQSGAAGSNLDIAVGDSAGRKVIFQIPSGTSLCTARFAINVLKEDKTNYANDYFDITVAAK